MVVAMPKRERLFRGVSRRAALMRLKGYGVVGGGVSLVAVGMNVIGYS
jgi:hypothetical protein